MSSSKKIICKGTLLSEAQNPIPCSPFLTVHVYTIYLFTQGREAGVWSWTREKVRKATVHNFGRKYQHDWLHLQSINSYKHLPQSPFSGQNIFRWRHLPSIHMYVQRKKVWHVAVSLCMLPYMNYEYDYQFSDAFRCASSVQHKKVKKNLLVRFLRFIQD